MDTDLDQLREDLLAAIDTAAGLEALDAVRVHALGKQGAITAMLKSLGKMSPEERQENGPRIHALREAVTDAIAARKERLETAQLEAQLAAERMDMTLPVDAVRPGSIHPVSQVMDELAEIFADMGFAVASGPEIEDDWHNFSALNFPPDHPARDMQDTFFLEPPPPDGRGVLLRTHTSPVQVRVMEKTPPPIRVIAPGRVFRNEAISYKSYCLFHQVEGLVVDEGVSFADLKAMLTAFAKAFFGASDGPAREAKMRFRPSFFPFTEPSAEVDVWWADEAMPGGGRWMEILGSGMVDPNVLANVGVDPERFTGYAFGMGVERMAMLRHGIDDIRLLYENDVRFLRQF